MLFGTLAIQLFTVCVFTGNMLFELIAGVSNVLFLTTIASWAFKIKTELKLLVYRLLPEPMPVPTNDNVWFPGVVIVKLTV